jgi:predicted DNA-binding transcriptional regulator YafY
MSARDRQDAIHGWLRARGAATAAEIADHFRISLRTAHRDVAALRERDVPVQGDAGRGGGLRLDATRAMPALHLTFDEVIGLVVAVSLARRTAVLPFGGAARDGLGKLLAALPRERGRELRRALGRVVVGPPASPAVVTSLGPVDTETITTFERGFTAGRILAFDYVDRHGATSQRRAAPHGLLVQVPAWYLLAVDSDLGEPRMFRLDRVSSPRLLDERFSPMPLVALSDLLRDVETRPLDG